MRAATPFRGPGGTCRQIYSMTSNTENTMFYGATPDIFENAKLLRNKQTPAEKKLWDFLNKNKLGVKFRRQHPIATYIVDFYCHKLKLVIEVDGAYHLDEEQNSQDDVRTKELNQLGIVVIRFTNEEVLGDIGKVVKSINEQINRLKL
jgi:very-short-patch-repair endonuclease